MVDIMGIIDEKIDLIASFMPIGTLALLNDMCEKIFVFLRKLVFTVGDECVELRDLFLRFVFYVLLISFRCALGRNFFESKENVDKVDRRVDVVILWMEGTWMEGTCGRA